MPSTHVALLAQLLSIETLVYILRADEASPPLGAMTFEVLNLVMACRAIFTGIWCAIVNVEDVGDVLKREETIQLRF